MITLETGVPGAGKTLYCVDKLLRPLVGAKFKHEVEGEVVELPRRVFTNINGLLLEHTKIGPGPEWTQAPDPDRKGEKKWVQGDGDKLGLNNWHEWAKPGDVIVYDEVQKPWPMIAAGAAVAPCITALETHRHMGVDFIVLTQHPMLISQNLMRLVGRHLHIRRMGNLGLAIVYEWDSASRTLLYKNALAKAPYRYDKSVFELYKSAEAHTKQPRRIPSLIFGVLGALALLAYFGPSAATRISERVNPESTVAKVSEAAKLAASASVPMGGKSGAASGALGAAAIAEGVVPGVVPGASALQPEVLAGCVASGADCVCYNQSGKRMKVEPEICAEELGPLMARPVKAALGGYVEARSEPPRQPTEAELELGRAFGTRR